MPGKAERHREGFSRFVCHSLHVDKDSMTTEMKERNYFFIFYYLYADF